MVAVKSEQYRAVSTYTNGFSIKNYFSSVNPNSYEWFIAESKLASEFGALFQNNASLEYNATAIYGSVLDLGNDYFGLIPISEDKIKMRTHSHFKCSPAIGTVSHCSGVLGRYWYGDHHFILRINPGKMAPDNCDYLQGPVMQHPVLKIKVPMSHVIGSQMRCMIDS